MSTSRECKKAVNRNTTFGENLKKDLEHIEDKRKQFIRSQRKKKLNFLQKASALPKLRISLPVPTDENGYTSTVVSRHLSLDNSTLSELHERRTPSAPSLTTFMSLVTQDNLTKSGLGERNDMSLTKSPLARRRQSEFLPHETKTVLDRPQLSLPLKLITVAEADGCSLVKGQCGSISEVGPFKSSLRVPLPFASLGTQLPRSPLLQRKQRSFSVCPEDLKQSASLPSSPRFNRLRTESWNPEPSQERNDVFAELNRAARKLRSLSLDDVDIGKAKEEEVNNSQMLPRAPMSPEIRRLRALQPMASDQSQASKDDPVRLPRLQEARGSLPGLSSEEAERQRRRAYSMTPDKLADELSPQKEALNHRNVSPRLLEKLQHPLNVGNEWLNERETESRERGGSLFGWNSDDDDSDEGEEADNVFITKDTEKKLHSIEEIKYTRYLRMKSPEHWLPKTGKVPLNLLSSTIIVGHTKATFESFCPEQEEEEEKVEDEQDGFEEKPQVETGDPVKQLQIATTEKEEVEK